jgi:hypothetical protein
MLKKLLTTICAGSMALFLISACAEENHESDTLTADNSAIDNTQKANSSLMNKPVDFSTPESAEKTLQNIREHDGEKAYNHVTNAMQFIMVYDLNVRKKKELLYQKLDGLTPEEIIAQAKR